MDAIRKRLARNIRAMAKARGMRISHVPDRAGVGRANFWMVLKGASSPTLDWIATIASALDCDAADLVAKAPRASK